jgi:hypothetical protein
MPIDKDWRLTSQEKYLMGVSLVHRRYQPIGANDHDHCAFCWAKFMTKDSSDVLHEGYATPDGSHWICDRCFGDFRAKFHWIVVADTTPQT